MNDFNPMKFEEKHKMPEVDPRQREKERQTGNNLLMMVQSILWLLSALLSFAFGMSWFGPIFPLGDPFFASLAGGLFVAFNFDLSALVWLYVQDRAAETLDQQEIARRNKWVNFAGSGIASVAQMIFFIPANVLVVPDWLRGGIGWLIVTGIIVTFIYNLIESFRYHEASPKTLQAKHEAELKAQALKRQQDTNIAQANALNRIATIQREAEANTWGIVAKQLEERAAQLAGDIADRQFATLRAQLEEKAGMRSAPAPIVSQRKPQQTEEAPAVMAMATPDIVEIATTEGGADESGANFTPPPSQ